MGDDQNAAQRQQRAREAVLASEVSRFAAWANAGGHDVAYTFDTERYRHVFLNPMTADLWGAWRAAARV